MTRESPQAVWAVPLAVIAALVALQFVLPAYHHTNMARILLLAVFPCGPDDRDVHFLPAGVAPPGRK